MDLASPLYSVADALAHSPTKAEDRLEAQRERVSAARSTVDKIKAAGTIPTQIVAQITDKHTHGLVGHRLVTPAQQAKFPQAVWEPKAASFFDKEALEDISNKLKREQKEVGKEIRQLEGRLSESGEAVERLNEKKRHLANLKYMKDFKVDLGLQGEKEEAGRDGWLNVPAPPANDKVAMQLHVLEMKLINKELLKGMGAVEEFARKAEGEASRSEDKLSRRKERLAQFPVKVIQNVEDVQRECIKLVDEKALLQNLRDDRKRLCSTKIREAKGTVSKMRDAVADESESLHDTRDDLKYWTGRLKIEKVKIEPVAEIVESMMADLDAVSEVEEGGLRGWSALVVKAAFLQGCNMDMMTSGSVGELRYNDLVDKVVARRIPEVCHAHMYPIVNLVTEEEVRTAAEKVGCWCDTEEFGESRFGFDEFYKIIMELRSNRDL